MPRQSGERRGCLSGWHAMELQKRSFRRPSSLRTSWMSVWVAFSMEVEECASVVRKRRGCLSGWHVAQAVERRAEEELPSTKQSEIVVDVCLGCILRRWRSAASVAQAVRKRRGCLSGWHSLLRQSENVVGVCLGGMQWSCRRGASVDQAV